MLIFNTNSMQINKILNKPYALYTQNTHIKRSTKILQTKIKEKFIIKNYQDFNARKQQTIKQNLKKSKT